MVDPTRKLVPQLIDTAARETYPVRIAVERGELVAYGHDGVRHVIPRGGRDGAHTVVWYSYDTVGARFSGPREHHELAILDRRGRVLLHHGSDFPRDDVRAFADANGLKARFTDFRAEKDVTEFLANRAPDAVDIAIHVNAALPVLGGLFALGCGVAFSVLAVLLLHPHHGAVQAVVTIGAFLLGLACGVVLLVRVPTALRRRRAR